ncbi:hypothetical protein RhiirA4_463495 [Rhizophagus irregularis]|uniref:Uncharacterized protein n=1 Tax=Rhizophagus irregularis TaxID=588596 RepID=A0A2I1GN26_9GLOM|nr:hypothetical protein RhiirA4_463495 [Rhizophagus irregularis]
MLSGGAAKSSLTWQDHDKDPHTHILLEVGGNAMRTVEDNNQNVTSSMARSNEGGLKTCSYCLGRGHNIRGCTKHKADKENVNQHNIDG